jgi:hypothetical protein
VERVPDSSKSLLLASIATSVVSTFRFERVDQRTDWGVAACQGDAGLA